MFEDDDDFGEFGGFEAADAVSNNEAQSLPQGVQASPSPWAVFPGSGMQPDLLLSQTLSLEHSCQQDHPDNRSLEEVIQSDVAAANNFNPVAPRQSLNGGFPSQIDAILEPPPFQADFSNLQSNPPESAASAQAFPSALDLDLTQAGVLELDLAQGTGDEPKLLNQASKPKESLPPDVSASAASESNFFPAAQDTNFAAALNAQSSSEGQNSELMAGDGLQVETSDGGSRNPNAQEKLDNKLDLAEQEESRILEDFQKLKISKDALLQELKEYEIRLEEQKIKYEKLQEAHALQLEEVKKGGQDALTVITQEYKELCKTSVLEQQVASEKHLQNVLTEQAERCQELLEAQHSRLTKILEQEESKIEAKIREAVEHETLKHKEMLEKALEEERKRSQEAIEVALKTERLVSQEAVHAAVRAEQEKQEQLLLKEKEKFQEFLAAEREESAKKLKEATEDEQKASKKVVSEALEEERQQSKDLAKQVLQQAREDMKQYVTEQRQADSVLRQRSLASMNLFLESTRTQLQLLMNSDSNELSNNTADKT